MQVLLGILVLGLMAGAFTLLAALFDDSWARRVSAILLARAEAREAYRERYTEALERREKEFFQKTEHDF